MPLAPLIVVVTNMAKNTMANLISGKSDIIPYMANQTLGPQKFRTFPSGENKESYTGHQCRRAPFS
jgi:hypothetical protein